MKRMINGLYAITDADLLGDEVLIEAVGEALLGGARILQYRNKRAERATQQAQAQQLAKLCQSRGVLFLINDDATLAAEVGADGVHVGRDDASIREARQLLGEDALIGVSCYNQLENALKAQDAGANYVAFGRFFPSKTKPDAVQAELELLMQAKQALTVPVVAIGGITQANAASLIEAGADSLAVIHHLWQGDDIRSRAASLAELFSAQ